MIQKKSGTKNFLYAALFLSCFLTACGVKKEEYDKVTAELSQASKQLESLEAVNESLVTAFDEQEIQYNKLSDEYAQYKESMSEYEDLSIAEAEARKIQAEELAESKAAAESQAAEEERLLREAEEKAGYDTGITYDQLARTPDEYEGKKVKFRGTVIQVIEGDDTTEIRLAVNGNYDTVIYCGYLKSIVSSRVLENDRITIYGTSEGTITYQSTMGGQITIPAVSVDKIDQ